MVGVKGIKRNGNLLWKSHEGVKRMMLGKEVWESCDQSLGKLVVSVGRLEAGDRWSKVKQFPCLAKALPLDPASRQEIYVRFCSRRENESGLGFRMILLMAGSPNDHLFWHLFPFPVPGTSVLPQFREFRANEGEFPKLSTPFNASVQSSHMLRI